MKTIFHPNSLSECIGSTFSPPSPSTFRTVPDTGFKQDKENRVGKATNSSAGRGNIRMFFSLLPDFVLFYFILAVDTALTAEIYLRSLSGAKENAQAG